jgi:hypothetical protein
VVAQSTRGRSGTMTDAYGIDKENFESYINEDLSEQITDEQWERVADEIHGRVNNFIDGLLEELVLDYEEGKGIFDEF